MGITYHTYVGPYVRCAVTMVDKQRMQLSCPNTNCRNHGLRIVSTRFCGLCGSQIASMTVTEQAPSVDQWDVREVLDERLCSPGGDGYDRWIDEVHAHLWIPNIRSALRDGHLEEREDFALIPLTAEQITDEVQAFRDAFTNDLAALIVQYGADNVTIQWGIIQHYS